LTTLNQNNMGNNKMDQDTFDKRLVIDQQIQDLLGSAFEDYGIDGLTYVQSEVTRKVESFKKEDETGRIV